MNKKIVIFILIVIATLSMTGCDSIIGRTSTYSTVHSCGQLSGNIEVTITENVLEETIITETIITETIIGE